MNNELNKLVADILSKNEGDTKIAIQQLFQIMATQPEQNHDIIRKAILFSMENLHEWANIMKYAEKWKMTEFKRGFISRMRKRLNQPAPASDSTETVDELKRLVEQYWKTRSPKKQENVYKQPIIIKPLPKSMNHETQNQSNHAIIEVKPQIGNGIFEKKEPPTHKPQVSTHHEGILTKAESVQSEQLDSNRSSSYPQKKERGDPLATVTGRPPILKKKSIFQNQPKMMIASNQASNQDKKQQEQANSKRGIPNARILNIMKRFADKEESKSTENWENFGRSKENSTLNKEEQFPPDKFIFGSNKKSTESEIMKKLPISPRKYDPANKIVKIIRNQSKSQDKKAQNFHQFSFASSERKEQPQASHNLSQGISAFMPIAEPAPTEQNLQPNSDQFVFQDNVKDSDRDETLIENDFHDRTSRKLSPTETPLFIYNDSKKRRSSVNRNQQALAIDEELKLYDPNIKLRYYIKEIEMRLGYDSATLFQQEFQKFLKDPQAFRL